MSYPIGLDCIATDFEKDNFNNISGWETTVDFENQTKSITFVFKDKSKHIFNFTFKDII